MIFKRKTKSRKLTAVGTVLSACHRDQVTGQVHGHTWEVTAWFPYNGTDQKVRMHQLQEQIDRLDHTCLPDRIAWGEQLAQYIADAINTEYACYGTSEAPCVRVDVSRPLERIYARWEA